MKVAKRRGQRGCGVRPNCYMTGEKWLYGDLVSDAPPEAYLARSMSKKLSLRVYVGSGVVEGP